MHLRPTTIPERGVRRTFRHPVAGVWFAATRMTLPVAISNEGGTSYVVRVESSGAVIEAFESVEPMSATTP